MIIYPVHNRLEYVRLTLPPVLAEGVKVLIIDDNSTDGTSEYIQEIKGDAEYIRREVGNSTQQWNIALQYSWNYICKIDNDILITPGTFRKLKEQIEGSKYFGISPTVHGGDSTSMFPYITTGGVKDASHIGGVGIFRRKVFNKLGRVKKGTLPGEQRFFGFTAYQNEARRRGYPCGISEAVKVIELDRSPIYSRLNEYTEKGYSRNIIGEVKSIFNQ